MQRWSLLSHSSLRAGWAGSGTRGSRQSHRAGRRDGWWCEKLPPRSHRAGAGRHLVFLTPSLWTGQESRGPEKGRGVARDVQESTAGPGGTRTWALPPRSGPPPLSSGGTRDRLRRLLEGSGPVTVPWPRGAKSPQAEVDRQARQGPALTAALAPNTGPVSHDTAPKASAQKQRPDPWTAGPGLWVLQVPLTVRGPASTRPGWLLRS